MKTLMIKLLLGTAKFIVNPYTSFFMFMGMFLAPTLLSNENLTSNLGKISILIVIFVLLFELIGKKIMFRKGREILDLVEKIESDMQKKTI